MDAIARRQHHEPVRVLHHIKTLDDCVGDFLVRVSCPCGASRHIEPEVLARIAGRSLTLAQFATRMRCSQCGKKLLLTVCASQRSFCNSPGSATAFKACPSIKKNL
jgi:hypothetical protein